MMQPTEWEPVRWFRLVDNKGRVLAEANNTDQLRDLAGPDDRIERLFRSTGAKWADPNSDGWTIG